MQSYAVIEDAFRKLEQKPLAYHDTPFERYTSEIWGLIDQRIPGFGPRWYRALTESYRVAGAGFEYPFDREREWLGLCGIPRPSMALYYVYAEGPVLDLLKQGWFCFAEGADGNLWMFAQEAKEDPEVHELEATGWDGGEATLDNGIISPGITLRELLKFGASWVPSKPGAK